MTDEISLEGQASVGSMGFSILKATPARNPGPDDGRDGDWWIHQQTSVFFEKQGGVWTAIFKVRGSLGPPGPAGVNGRTIHTGSAVPDAAIGDNGEFYIRLSGDIAQLYGPKASDVWPAPISIVGPRGTSGFKYLFEITTTNADPTAGKFKFDNATFMSATKWYVSETDADANGIGAFLATLDDGAGPNKSRVTIKNAIGTVFRDFFINGTVVDGGAWNTFDITPIATSGSLVDEAEVFVSAVHLQKGDTGLTGPIGLTGPGYGGTSTSSLAIGSGSKVFATQTGYAWQAGGRVRASSAANVANWMEGPITSYAGGNLTVNVDLVGGSGTHADWNFNATGERGAQGAPGSGTGDVVSSPGTYIAGNMATFADTTGDLIQDGGTPVTEDFAVAMAAAL